MPTSLEQRLADVLEDPTRVRWLPARELKGLASVACIDGRHERGTIAAPGGNAGELVLLLAVAEWYRGAPYRDDDIERLVGQLVAELGDLYIHTDDHAFASFARAAGRTPQELARALRENAPLDERALAALAEPETTGCGHLRAMLEDPGPYRVRRALVLAVMRSLVRRAFAGQGVHLVVLHGAHDEQAVVVLHTPGPVDGDTLLPVVDAGRAPRFFTENLPGLRFLRRAATELLLSLDPELRRTAPGDLLLEVERLGERQLNLTVGRLAPHLPRFRATFRGDGRLALDAF